MACGCGGECCISESKTIKSIQNLADKNKYGTVSGTRMNGKTAREIIAIYNHPKMKSFRGKMDKMKSHELMDLTIRLPKMLGIKVESVNEVSSYGEYVEDNARMLAQDYRRQDKKLAKALDHIADRINQSYPGRNRITKNDVKDIIKQPYNRKLMRPMMRFNLDDLFESVNEKVGKVGAIKKAFPWAKGKMMNVIQMAIEMDADGLAGVMKNYKKNPSAYKQFVRDMSKMKGLPSLEEMKDAMKNAIHQVKTFDKPSNAKLMTIKVINKLKQKRNSSKSASNKKELQKMIDKVEGDYKKGKYLKESVDEATSLGADMLLGGIATVIKKAGMRPMTAKMMGGGFKVSKRDKVGFKIEVEIRGMDKKKTFPLQFETERGMLYVVIKNKPIKLGKYTMVAQAAQNLKKVGMALIGDKDVKRIA
jgi:phage shock protein A